MLIETQSSEEERTELSGVRINKNLFMALLLNPMCMHSLWEETLELQFEGFFPFSAH